MRRLRNVHQDFDKGSRRARAGRRDRVKDFLDVDWGEGVKGDEPSLTETRKKTQEKTPLKDLCKEEGVVV